MSRLIRDALLVVTRVLPAAAANNNSSSIDLGDVTPVLHGQNHELLIEVPELPALVEDKTLTITIQDSADDTNFAAVEELATFVVTGGVGDGADATTRTYRLPSSVKRYVRINCAVLTAGGDNTGVTVTARILS
jgi:hypothetical protein